MLLVILPGASHARAAAEAAPAVRADFYVAPNGDDTSPGTRDAPFATLRRARNAVRERIAVGLKSHVLVLLRGGVYAQPESLVFGPEDSGSELFTITYAAYPGEHVVLSGGHRITGWRKAEGNVWTAEIPEVKAGQWCFRQLFINGRRAVRARSPNVGDPVPWWIIRTAREDKPFTVTVNRKIPACGNASDMEFICNYNNEGSRERLESIDADGQTLTLTPRMRFNPKCFTNDWSLGKPEPGKPCYLENARELLDEPGEWYLDRKSGRLAYWPRPGEDLARAEVIAPVAQTTLLAVRGTPQKPVRNVRFKGIHVEYLDWPLPEAGYMGLFSCNVATSYDDNAGHRFIDAAVEFEHARSCDFVDGGIAHAGACGLCLRDGTAYNTIEGNDIGDLGGNGIGAGGCHVGGGNAEKGSPPGVEEYRGYRITNNHIHDVGTDYFGGSGILLYLSQEALVAHNLVHDCAYFGIAVAGSRDTNAAFTKNNTLEYNHIYRAMKVTVDGAGLYITFGYFGNGMLVRGNLVHDTLWNRFGRGDVMNDIHDTIPCHGLYLDGDSWGCRYERNVVYANAGGPLLLNSEENRNRWSDNIFQKDGTPPREFLEAMCLVSGLEPGYRELLGQASGERCNLIPLTDNRFGEAGFTAYQFDRPASGQGVIEVFRQAHSQGDATRIVPRELDPVARYVLTTYVGQMKKADRRFYEGTFFGSTREEFFTRYVKTLGELPILAGVTAPWAKATLTGRELLDRGLPVQLSEAPAVAWIVYKRQP